LCLDSNRQIDFSSIEAFEKDMAFLLQVRTGQRSVEIDLVNYSPLQDLFHAAWGIVQTASLSLRAIDLLPDPRNFCCSDEILVEMKDWCCLDCFARPAPIFSHMLNDDESYANAQVRQRDASSPPPSKFYWCTPR
jgi:hypothetical protein